VAHRWGWLGMTSILLLCVGYQVLVHSAVNGALPKTIRLTLTFMPLLALALWVVTRARNKPLWLLVLLVAGLGTYMLADRDAWGLAAAYGIPHAAIYLGLLWLFGHTLLPGKEPLITRLARRVHGVLQPDLEGYSPQFIADIVESFESDMSDLIERLEAITANVDWSELADIRHTMEGTARGSGACGIAALVEGLKTLPELTTDMRCERIAELRRCFVATQEAMQHFVAIRSRTLPPGSTGIPR
jgi:HPt (histidine-containing phosphotransfer) domain-containing protein